jgi:hypothetical protein
MVMKKFLFIFLLSTTIASAQIVNPGLETTFNGWQTIGDGLSDTACLYGHGPQPMLVNNFSPIVVPQQGNQMAQIANGGSSNLAAIASFAEVSPGTIQGTQLNTPTYGGAIKQKFFVHAGASLSFNYLFTTTESPSYGDPYYWINGMYNYNDFAFYSLKSSSGTYATRLADLTTLYNYSMSQGSFPGHLYNGHYVYNDWLSVNLVFPVDDTITLTIGVMNCGDNTAPSDLLIDNFVLNNPPVISPVNFSGSINQSINLDQVSFQNSFSDPDGDPLTGILFINLPAHGTMVYHNFPVVDTLDATQLYYQFSTSEIDSFTYYPDFNYVGNDTVHYYSNGSVYPSYILFSVVNPLGITVAEVANGVSVFPNPANDQIRIVPDSEKDQLFELFSADGMLLRSEMLSGNTEKIISVQDLSCGFYLYRINGSSSTAGRLVITR